MSNSAPGAIINGTNKTASGRLSLVYTGVNPSFIITNGGMTLSASTTFKVTKTGAALPLGVYILPIHANAVPSAGRAGQRKFITQKLLKRLMSDSFRQLVTPGKGFDSIHPLQSHFQSIESIIP